jgi:hypothetical protein
MRLPDPRRSRAVLIGVGRYSSAGLEDLPAVANNLRDLAGRLAHPLLGALSADSIAVLPDPGDVRTVYRALRQCAAGTEDTVLVYFAGHGMVTGPRNELYLALAGTDPDELAVSALPYELIREVLRDSPAENKVVILDCCFAGRAIDAMSGAGQAILGQIAVAGTYTLAATPANALALAPAGARHTAFTGALLQFLDSGLPGGPELLTLHEIYRHLRHRMRLDSLPLPEQRTVGMADSLALTRNPACTRPGAASAPARAGFPAPDPPQAAHTPSSARPSRPAPAPQSAPDPPSGKPPADRTQISVARIGMVSAIVATAIGAAATVASTLLSNRDPAGTALAPSASATVLSSSGTGLSATAQSPATAPSSTETPKAVASQLFLSSQSPSRAATAALSAKRFWEIENAPFSHSIGFPGLCSRADVTYNLNGAYTFFHATAGIADGLSSKDTSRSVEFDVFNGKSGAEIYSVTAQYGKSQTINLPVKEGITSVRLEASVVGGGCLSSQSVVVWGDALLRR